MLSHHCSYGYNIVVLSCFFILFLNLVSITIAADHASDTTHFNPQQTHLSQFTIDYIQRAKYLFRKKFEDKCLKYPFVKHYLQLNDENTFKNNPDGRNYMVYTMYNAKGNIGGLGDRFAGVITGLGFALRSNRTFLLHGEKSVEDYFQPYQLKNDNRDLSWSSWKWANYDSQYASNLDDVFCVNPRRQGHCYLENSSAFQKRVLKFVGNRCILCRWAIRTDQAAYLEMKNLLGIDENTDLYEASGCLLRLILHPTERLSHDLARFIDHLQGHKHQPNHNSTATGASTNTSNDRVHHIDILKGDNAPVEEKKIVQVGFHFRCGDGQLFGDTKAPPCVVEPEKKWVPILFYDETSPESPVDVSSCAADSFHNLSATVKEPIYAKIAFIASDNKSSAAQMDHNPKKNWEHSFIPQHICHVDGNHDVCGHITLLQWFTLSLSDAVVMQSFPLNIENANIDNPQFLKELQSRFPVQNYPSSAFSRFAAIYGFSRIRFGSECSDVNTTTLGHHSHSNWRCDPKVFIRY